jgi:hypothetical protein
LDFFASFQLIYYATIVFPILILIYFRTWLAKVLGKIALYKRGARIVSNKGSVDVLMVDIR